jgi:hypothetical protein
MTTVQTWTKISVFLYFVLNWKYWGCNPFKVDAIEAFIPLNRAIHVKLLVAQLVKKFPIIFKLEDSLPCSQESATGLFSEPDDSSPHPYTYFLNIILLLQYSTIYARSPLWSLSIFPATSILSTKNFSSTF